MESSWVKDCVFSDRLFCHHPIIALNSAEVEIDSLTFFNVPLFIFLDRKYGEKHLLRRIPRALYGRFDPYIFTLNLVTETISTLIIFHYNIARVHPYLIPIGVIMVHFSTYARPCVHPMTCASQIGEACARCAITEKLLQIDNTKKMNIYKSLKLNETLRLN